MNTNFFIESANKEKNRRHFNTVFSLCSGYFMTPENIEIFSNIRNNNGYIELSSVIYNNYLYETHRQFLDYLKKRYNINDDTYYSILGFKEPTPNIKTPGGYTQEEGLVDS